MRLIPHSIADPKQRLTQNVHQQQETLSISAKLFISPRYKVKDTSCCLCIPSIQPQTKFKHLFLKCFSNVTQEIFVVWGRTRATGLHNEFCQKPFVLSEPEFTFQPNTGASKSVQQIALHRSMLQQLIPWIKRVDWEVSILVHLHFRNVKNQLAKHHSFRKLFLTDSCTSHMPALFTDFQILDG